MPRVYRVDVGEHIYHVLNRANARVQIFDSPKDYEAFEAILEEGVRRYGMRILAYCLMPNHWHLVLYPVNDGDLSKFMSWVTNTHTRRWHCTKGTIGYGHLYQGRYKSFLCQEDSHFLTLVRYVERNALKANLVNRAEKWRWSSIWRRTYGTDKDKALLSLWPLLEPSDYIDLLNKPQTKSEEEAFVRSLAKNVPFGNESWQEDIIGKYGLEQVMRNPGRPKNGG